MRILLKAVAISAGLLAVNASRGDLKNNTIVTLKSLNSVHSPQYVYLDSYTKDTRVYLSPSTDGKLTGTRWRVMYQADETVSFQNVADGLDTKGTSYLEAEPHTGKVFLSEGLKTDPTCNFGTHFFVEAVTGGWSLRTKALPADPKHTFLSAHTDTGIVDMVEKNDQSLTSWKIEEWTGTIEGKASRANKISAAVRKRAGELVAQEMAGQKKGQKKGQKGKKAQKTDATATAPATTAPATTAPATTAPATTTPTAPATTTPVTTPVKTDKKKGKKMDNKKSRAEKKADRSTSDAQIAELVEGRAHQLVQDKLAEQAATAKAIEEQAQALAKKKLAEMN